MMAYTDYKKSLYPFDRMIPSHWEETYLSRAYSLKSITGHTSEDLLSVFLDKGVINYNESDNKQVHKPSEDMSKYQLVEPDDFVMNNQQAWRGSVGISKYRGIISPAYYIWTPRNDYNPKYMNFMLRDKDVVDQFVLASKGVGSIQRQIYVPYMKTTVLAIPPREEQDQIVRYLDWKVSRINKLIHGYQRKIKLLEERKLTLINNAVTKGIHPDADMQHIDSNWMGDIPAHWTVDKIKQHFHIQKDIADEEGFDVISITQQGLKVKDISKNEGQMAQNYAKYQFVRPGDFAMNHMDLLTGYVGLSDHFGVTSPDYRVFVLDDEENCVKEYYLLIFQLCYKRKIFYGLGRGAANKGRWRMPAVNFKNFDIPVPPKEEQEEIVAWVNVQVAQIDLLIGNIENMVNLLKEYRTRLISDVVTGQIDVRDVVIPDYEPEEDGESEEPENEESEIEESVEA
jgi:type I restriction enzyme S subunit